MEDATTVCAVFGERGVVPTSFTHAGRTRKVDRVAYRWKKREGTEQIFYFSVLSGGEQFTLSFATRTLKWKLEQDGYF